MIPDDSRGSLHAVLLGVWLGFPHGMAASSRARLLALAMHAADIDVRVICARAVDWGPVCENNEPRGSWRGVPFEYPGGRTVRSPSFVRRRVDDTVATVATAARLVSLKRQARLDCVYLYVAGQLWTPAVSLLVVLLRLLRVPIVLELNELPWTMRTSQTYVQRLSHPLAGMRGVVAISGEIAEWVRCEARRRRKAIEVLEVPILVDVEEQSPSGPRRASRTVLFAGDASEQNLAILGLIREAMERVWQQAPDCRLVIVGADPADPALLSVLQRGAAGRVDSRVELSGYVGRDELLRLYQRAWVLLLPLLDDAQTRARFPTKVGEYLASGRPVVTSDVGEIGRYLSDGDNAFVGPPGDAMACARAVYAALEDAAGAAQVGAEGRHLAEREFHFAVHSRALRDMLDRCMGADAVAQ